MKRPKIKEELRQVYLKIRECPDCCEKREIVLHCPSNAKYTFLLQNLGKPKEEDAKEGAYAKDNLLQHWDSQPAGDQE